MANYLASVIKNYQGYEYTNVWKLTANSDAEAVTGGILCMNFERSFTSTAVEFERLVVAVDPDPSHQNFYTLEQATHGLLNLIAPLAVPDTTMYVTISLGAGRVGKKEFRFCLQNNEVTAAGANAQYIGTPGAVSALRSGVSTLLTDLAAQGCNLAVGKHFRTGSSYTIDSPKPGNSDVHKRYYDIKSKSA